MKIARIALRWSGAPARVLLLASIRCYRATVSGRLGGQCRFYPSCSHYAEDAIRLHGATKGALLATWRLLRCNPYGRGGIDPVRARYDGVIRGHAMQAAVDP